MGTIVFHSKGDMDQPVTLRDHVKYVSRIRREAGARGGKAPHGKRGLTAMTPERLKEVARLGVAARAMKRLNKVIGGKLDELPPQ